MKKNATILLFLLVSSVLWAHRPLNRGPRSVKGVESRNACANSEAQIDQEINNVRARLLAGGDCWWNFSDGQYIVPKPQPGQPEVSAITAAAVWIGGVDPGGNLKMAAQDYRIGNNPENDYWPGPLNQFGITDKETCKNWDRHFRVTSDDINLHLQNLANGLKDEKSIPRAIRGWPARGNRYFSAIYGFSLPTTNQGLAGFYDANDDGLYEPLQGDYPVLELRGCPLDRYPDELIFWIYNDEGAGSAHAVSNGKALQMEVQAQAFSYKTNDALNDMTFQRHKFINRGVESMDSTFFALWADPDLGCGFDDYVGCDRSLVNGSPRNLMYVYNQDKQDGDLGCNCSGTPTYCDRIPILGIDFIRGPLDESGEETDMFSFMYINNASSATSLSTSGTTLPNENIQYYRYMTGSWADGSPLTFGGTGKGGTVATRYAFPDAPNNPTGWSMMTAGLSGGDYSTVQSYGPFRLDPGAVNEMVFGVPFADNQAYPAPDLEALLKADQLARITLNNVCDKFVFSAPGVEWVELDKELVAVLDGAVSEDFRTIDQLAPAKLPENDRLYKFEGYIVYQLLDSDVQPDEYDDPDLARIVSVVDVRNNAAKLYNWEPLRDPQTNRLVYRPIEMVAAENSGIRHTFQIKEDKFAQGNANGLINHRRYYYAVVAYAHNNYEKFDPAKNKGQQTTFLKSNQNLHIYTVIPRPVTDLSLQASYGDGPAITRLEGGGSGLGNFLDWTDETRDALFSPGLKDTILTYKPGHGPISVTIFNPFEVKNGEYELKFTDNTPNDAQLDANARWQLRRLPDGTVITSERTIGEVNEQIVSQYGFSILASHGIESGDRSDPNYGFIGGAVEYANPLRPWLQHYAQADFPPFNYLLTAGAERDRAIDPNGVLNDFSKNSYFLPYSMYDWMIRTMPGGGDRLFTPAWTEGIGKLQGNLNMLTVGTVIDTNGVLDFSKDKRLERFSSLPNVDIVLTNDKSKWSRCVVVETASLYYTNDGNDPIEQLRVPKDPTLQTERGPNNKPRLMFDTRAALSVGKEDANGDGLPDPDKAIASDGAPDAGQPLRGMGWFPGYAIDVETGQRLNVFFGENSCYDKALDPQYTGRDMLWNPTGQMYRTPTLQSDYYDFVGGGQHWVYVMNTPYDECEALRRRLTPELHANPPSAKVVQMRNIAWAAMLGVTPGMNLKSLREGLIANETILKLRVGNRYQTWWNDATTPMRKNGLPTYRFTIAGKEPLSLSSIQVSKALDSIKVVPNPYYGFSQYETSASASTVKITNLPGKCTVTIYALDGTFVQQFRQDEVYEKYAQIKPAIEWDLKNNAGRPIASGIYLIHVNAPGIGERTLKWMGVLRQ